MLSRQHFTDFSQHQYLFINMPFERRVHRCRLEMNQQVSMYSKYATNGVRIQIPEKFLLGYVSIGKVL